MIERPRLTYGFAITLLAFSPSIVRAQVPRLITVEYQNAPLSQVIRGFAAFSGRAIVVAPDAGDPEVTASMKNVDWQVGLDRILESQALVARPDTSGVVRIERRRQVTVEFQDAPLSRVIRAFASFSGRAIVLTPGAGDPSVTIAVRDEDWQRALDDILESCALVARLDASGVVLIERRNPAPVKP
jgi:type II secretory pathway component HofQ